MFVTKTFEDAKLAARTVVRGCPSVVTANGEHIWNDSNDDDEMKRLQNYSLVIPVGGDGTLSGWINTMVDEILLFHKLEHDSEEGTSSKNNKTTTNNGTSNMTVEEAMQQLPVLAYIPMGTGNGLGYVIGCKAGKSSSVVLELITSCLYRGSSGPSPLTAALLTSHLRPSSLEMNMPLLRSMLRRSYQRQRPFSTKRRVSPLRTM